MLGEHVAPIHTLRDLVHLLEDEQVLVAAFVGAEEDVPAMFLDTARVLKDKVRFISLHGPVFSEAFSIQHPKPRRATLVVLRQHQESVVWAGGPVEAERLKRLANAKAGTNELSEAEIFAVWVTQHIEKLVEPLSQENFQRKVGGSPAF